MPSFSVLRTLAREVVTRERAVRVAEPDLVMDDPDKVAAFTRAGREDGVMAPVYLFHTAQICEVIRPGDLVIDLGCGPATQLAMVARLNPGVRFVGIDLSADMLKRAENHVQQQGLQNVDFRMGDITNLDCIPDGSADAVISTVALHHLPDLEALDAAFSEIRRVLRPDGGIYLVDFGHLKSEKSINYFAYQYADRQPELFTLDYLYSLRAAFQLDDFRQLTARYLSGLAEVKSTFLMPFMVTVKSRQRIENPGDEVVRQIRCLRDDLPSHHKVDLADLTTFFRLGGLPSPLLR